VDIAVNLVESYLRLNGYLTLSEFEIQGRDADGGFTTITDVDIVAMRSPGDVYLGDPHDADDCRLLLIEDPALRLEEDCLDVIIGEVKQGMAVFNPALKDHRVLHSVLRRFAWLYEGGSVAEVVTSLQQHGSHRAPARGGGEIRTRLVAFGRADEDAINTIRIGHIVETLGQFFHDHDEAVRPIQFREPAIALLRLLHKSGFSVER
jgi:hypothetical protein